MAKKVYQEISQLLIAIGNCKAGGNDEWRERHTICLREIVQYRLPHGSGIDAGLKIDMEKSNPDNLVFTFGFHFMDSNGYYAGWEYYRMVVKPSLAFDIDIKIYGINRNQIKDYLHELMQYALTKEVKS